MKIEFESFVYRKCHDSVQLSDIKKTTISMKKQTKTKHLWYVFCGVKVICLGLTRTDNVLNAF